MNFDSNQNKLIQYYTWEWKDVFIKYLNNLEKYGYIRGDLMGNMFTQFNDELFNYVYKNIYWKTNSLISISYVFNYDDELWDEWIIYNENIKTHEYMSWLLKWIIDFKKLSKEDELRYHDYYKNFNSCDLIFEFENLYTKINNDWYFLTWQRSQSSSFVNNFNFLCEKFLWFNNSDIELLNIWDFDDIRGDFYIVFDKTRFDTDYVKPLLSDYILKQPSMYNYLSPSV